MGNGAGERRCIARFEIRQRVERVCAQGIVERSCFAFLLIEKSAKLYPVRTISGNTRDLVAQLGEATPGFLRE